MRGTTRPLKWVWDKKYIPLDKLEDGQLYHIRDKLLKENKKRKWFGVRTTVWRKSISIIIRQRERKNLDDISNEIIGRRIRKAGRIADVIANGIYKAMNKNSYEQTVTN